MSDKIEVIVNIGRGSLQTVAAAQAAGYDAICFSGTDKLVMAALMAQCRKMRIRCIGEAYSWDDAQSLMELKAERIKIASDLIDQTDVLDKIAQCNIPVLLATGACSYFEMRQAIGCFAAHNRVIMHAVETFPTEPRDMNLLVLKTIRSNFRGELGLVDTSIGTNAALIAMGLGARTFEKAWLEDGMWHDYARTLKAAATMLGSERKQLLPVEAHAHARAQ